MSRRRSAERRSGALGRGIRAGVARLVWGVCSLAAVLLAGAVLLRTLRADAAALPWEQWFALADLLTPGPVADLAVPEVALLRAEAWSDAFGWGVSALLWLLAGLLLTLLLRPSAARPVVATQFRQASAPGDSAGDSAGN